MNVIVHGGAGGEPDEPTPRQGVLDEAAQVGGEAETVVDAVEAAVHVLESSPRFNAGVGGAVQSDGVVRTDAGIMTSDREAGAACSMPGVEHAVSAARVVMEETPHVFVSGEHAVDLAADFGVETGVDLWTEKSRERWAEHDTPDGSPSEHLNWLREKFGGHDTVGAVAYDGTQFAAATSTGGRWLALAGRVGDVPQIGSGFYAAPAGAASSTGAGEDIAKVTLTRRAVRHLESGYDAGEAADRAIEEFAELTGSEAGVIVLDRDGNSGSAFNTDAMQTAVNR
ncbi:MULTISPECIES: isoaspartyl peptidase/L-asparaginase family protein [unclassified Haladaptatus]|uniref:isoaspartyl peptidase/L-asparaginase n=1 Tax=unclassified Haladaptatus TaxID=2622732 RepID=UPI00209C3A44|nr:MULTISPECIES: isoaspartyl peptidase/L-asparaginase family protein [unclassified Haladaptatus]MCO8243168.1 isoaspartyl peptidase/L-asparaginase family protein [Haladaptatus sp. AB643]MCO8252880.1 isoaspartyl peptidase/L-asparaginase family protein [Haladaptatus sp. AB618]